MAWHLFTAKWRPGTLLPWKVFAEHIPSKYASVTFCWIQFYESYGFNYQFFMGNKYFHVRLFSEKEDTVGEVTLNDTTWCHNPFTHAQSLLTVVAVLMSVCVITHVIKKIITKSGRLGLFSGFSTGITQTAFNGEKRIHSSWRSGLNFF